MPKLIPKVGRGFNASSLSIHPSYLSLRFRIHARYTIMLNPPPLFQTIKQNPRQSPQPTPNHAGKKKSHSPSSHAKRIIQYPITAPSPPSPFPFPLSPFPFSSQAPYSLPSLSIHPLHTHSPTPSTTRPNNPPPPPRPRPQPFSFLHLPPYPSIHLSIYLF